MALNINKEVEKLKQMTVKELKAKYNEVFGQESRSNNKPFLWKRIAWRLQALEQGSLSERAHKRAEELAKHADLRIRVPKGTFNSFDETSNGPTLVTTFSPSHDRRIPVPGTILTRLYREKNIRVTVLEKGFEYEGQVYRSLSAIAKVITGTQWNGFGFFGILNKGHKK
jgi:hypothetical protein